MPQNNRPQRIIREPGESSEVFTARILSLRLAEQRDQEFRITSTTLGRQTFSNDFSSWVYTGNAEVADVPAPNASSKASLDETQLKNATESFLSRENNSRDPRPNAERRERDYIALIQNERVNRKSPSELLHTEKPVYLPYIGYNVISEIEKISGGRLFKKDGGWFIKSSSSDLTIPLEYSFMCMGEFFESTKIPNPQLCARCNCVRIRCKQVKDYKNQDMFLCIDCASRNHFPCMNCSLPVSLPYFKVGLCTTCIETPDPSRPLRSFYKGRKWCGTQLGNIMQTLRVFSFEVEGVMPNHRYVDILGAQLLPEAGLSGDSSIREGLGVEVQSPQLAGINGEEFTNHTTDALRETKVLVNDSCGMHIHLDGGGIIPTTREAYPEALVDLWKAYLIFEDIIFSFLPFNRRINRYCRPMRDYFKISEIEMIETMFDAEKLWYKQQDANSIRSEKQQHHHASRYFGVNLHSLFANNHLELRHHSGTTNAKKILQWANLHALIMDAAQSGMFTQEFLAEAQATTSIKDKTIMLFDAIHLGKQQRQYFYQRQAKFSDKKQREDGVLALNLPEHVRSRHGYVSFGSDSLIIDADNE